MTSDYVYVYVNDCVWSAMMVWWIDAVVIGTGTGVDWSITVSQKLNKHNHNNHVNVKCML